MVRRFGDFTWEYRNDASDPGAPRWTAYDAVRSMDLEKAHLEYLLSHIPEPPPPSPMPSPHLKFKRGDFDYTVNFELMLQTNESTSTQRNVRRLSASWEYKGDSESPGGSCTWIAYPAADTRRLEAHALDEFESRQPIHLADGLYSVDVRAMMQVRAIIACPAPVRFGQLSVCARLTCGRPIRRRAR